MHVLGQPQVARVGVARIWLRRRRKKELLLQAWHSKRRVKLLRRMCVETVVVAVWLWSARSVRTLVTLKRDTRDLLLFLCLACPSDAVHDSRMLDPK